MAGRAVQAWTSSWECQLFRVRLVLVLVQEYLLLWHAWNGCRQLGELWHPCGPEAATFVAVSSTVGTHVQVSHAAWDQEQADALSGRSSVTVGQSEWRLQEVGCVRRFHCYG